MGFLFPVGFAIAAVENEENWSWFLECLRTSLKINDGGTNLVILSDRQKGLLKAISSALPNAIHGFCSRHLLKNVQKEANFEGMDKLFWGLVNANTSAKFQSILNEIKSKSKAAFDYLSGIDPKTYAKFCFPGSRYGFLTSNLAEITNSLLKERRRLPHIGIIHWFYCWIMEKHYERRIAIDSMKGNANCFFREAHCFST